MLFFQHNAAKREERRLALIDKGLDTTNKGIDVFDGYLVYKMNHLPLSSLSATTFLEDESGESGLAGLIESGSESETVVEGGSGIFSGKLTEQQRKYNLVYNYYISNPEDALEDGVKALGMPVATLSRYHANLVDKHYLNPFPKNRQGVK